MKKAIFVLSIATFTGLSAQNSPIQIEVVDRTEITMLAAQYDIMQREQRQAQAQKNYDVALKNFQVLNNDLTQLQINTNDKNILKRISKANKQNDRLLILYNSRNYSTEIIKIQSEIKFIYADIQKLTH